MTALVPSLSLAALSVAVAATAGAQSSVSAGALSSGDDQGFRWDQYQVELQRAAGNAGQWLVLRFHRYSLAGELAGVLPFHGSEAAGELGGHVLLGSLWLSASAGFQGSVDWSGIMGKLAVANAFTSGASSFTPRFELAREPLGLSALPLSFGLAKQRADAVLAWRAPGVTAEGGARIELWASGTLPDRVRNPERDFIEGNRITLLHAYVLSDFGHWFDCGLAARALWSERSTLMLTGLNPATYTWYPASAPPRALESALILRAAGRPVQPLELTLQLQLPLVSQEVREWEGLRRAYWGSAPFEAKLGARWAIFEGTTIEIDALAFARPWEHWDVVSGGAYQQASVQLGVEQRL